MLRLRADMQALPQDAVNALRFGMRGWLFEPTHELWRRGGKIDFEITITARTKAQAAERKLVKENGE